MMYGKLVNGKVAYVPSNKVEIGGMVIFNPSESLLNKAGIYKVKDIEGEGTNIVKNNLLYNYIGTRVELPKGRIIEDYQGSLDDTSDLIQALERLIAANGVTEADRKMAAKRIELRDKLGKTPSNRIWKASGVNSNLDNI